MHHCGHDCIPWDVCVHQLADLLRQHGDSISRVDCFDEIAFAASGGTLYTTAASITAAAALHFTALMQVHRHQRFVQPCCLHPPLRLRSAAQDQGGGRQERDGVQSAQPVTRRLL